MRWSWSHWGTPLCTSHCPNVTRERLALPAAVLHSWRSRAKAIVALTASVLFSLGMGVEYPSTRRRVLCQYVTPRP